MRISQSIGWFLIVTHCIATTATAHSNSLSLSRAKSSEQGVTMRSGSPELPTKPLALRDLAWVMTQHFDPSRYYSEDLIEALNYEALPAFEYVRDEIGFDPYHGTLRGVEGVLGAQAGNAYDRSLLLSRLLRDMGFEARMVFGKLSPENSERLFERAVNDAPVYQIKPTELLNERSHTQLLRRAKKDFAWLSSALQDAEIGTNPKSADKEDVVNHTWVQARLDGEWTDLDSAFPNAEPGDVFADIERYAIDTRTEEHHRVEISVVGETLSKTGLREESVLDVKLKASEAMNQQIFLHFKPHGKLIGRTIVNALGPGAKFRPVISINGDPNNGKTLPGIFKRPKDQSVAEQFFYGDDLAVTSAVYLDIRVIRPDGTASHKRRSLFDRVNPKTRRSGNLSRDRLTPLPVSKGIPRAYQEIHQVLISTGGLNPYQTWNDAGYGAWYISKLAKREGGLEKASFYEGLWALGMIQFSWLTLTEQLVIDALNDLEDARFFVAEPRVFVLSLIAEKSESGVGVRQRIDLMHDTVQSAALGDVDPTALAERQMWYGVLQSALETVSSQAFASAREDESEDISSTSLVTEGRPLAITSPEDIPPDAEVPAAMYQDIDNGALVVISGKTRQKIGAWWSVSAGNGATAAMLAPGLGGSSWRNRWIGPNAQLRAQRSVGGVVKPGKSYYLPEGWDEQFKKGNAKKVKSSPPPNCRSGGTEYQTLTCGVGLSTITAHTLVIANVGLAMLIGMMVVYNALKPEIEITD